MNLHYFLVFIGALLVDVTPLPLPPAFTVMVYMQIKYDLNIWAVISIGVAGSVTGRYLLTLFISKISTRLFTKEKNADAEFLGKKLKQKGWKSPLLIFTYSLLPLPTTPLFVAGGMAKIKPWLIIPPFFVGKFISDAITVITGKYVAENSTGILEGIISWKSISGLILGLILLFALVFIDWRTLLLKKKFALKFNILREKGV
jgi:membrane protein YqaA with SNARE-associated domain